MRKLSDILPSNQGGGKVAILLRHSERLPIPPDSYGIDIPLTERGRSDAIEFGRCALPYNTARIYTSPVARCVETAKCIAQGYNNDVEVSMEDNLGNPGLHISDAERAGAFFLHYGAIGVYEKFVQGERMAGIADPAFLKGAALRWIEAKCSSNGISLFITHDSLIAHIAYANSIKLYSRNSWVGYLDGIAFVFPSEIERSAT